MVHINEIRSMTPIILPVHKQSAAALLSVGGACRESACPALLMQERCVQRRADTAEQERHRADTAMTAPSNTYDVIVVGGGISGRRISSKICSAGFVVRQRQTMYVHKLTDLSHMRGAAALCVR